MNDNKTPKKLNGCAITLLSIPALVIVIFLIAVSKSSPDYDDNRTFYDTGRFEDMTEDEFKDYLEWKEKQQDQEKIFK